MARLSALRNLTDGEGIPRKAGDSWLYRKIGNYLPSDPYIILVDTVDALIVKETVALHLKAKAEFTDVYKQKRKTGEEWLVTSDLASQHFVDVHEAYVKHVPITIVKEREFCILNNPVEAVGDTVQQKFGGRKLITGPFNFFLKPFEELENNHPLPIYVLQEDEALLLYAENRFKDSTGVERNPG